MPTSKTPPPHPLAAAPRTEVPAAAFFSLADDVLSQTGRPCLGEHQRSIIEVRDDDLVLQILAGPGAGKTEVLVWRVLYELFVRAADASRLMVTTFTRKAAQELNIRMVERSDAFLDAARKRDIDAADPRVHDLRTGTIHALCDELLNEFDDDHLAEGKAVIDEVETRLRLLRCRNWAFKDGAGRQLLKEVLAMEQLTSLFKPPWRDHLGTINQVDLTLALLNQHVETWIPRCGADQIPNGIETVHGPPGLTELLVQIQKRWSAQLESNHAMDYPLLQKRFLERQPGLTGQLDHVFVDEFQDTNPIQYAVHTGWVRHGGARLTVVGDDDQALYRWRGSDISCFEQLEPDCMNEKLAYRQEILQENNRSTATIVDFARAFRETTVLGGESLEKTVVSPAGNDVGRPVRLLEGDWLSLCALVAEEIDALGAGRILNIGEEAPPTVAILMASTSEVETRTGTRAALDLHRALEARGLRVYNPRNKAAARPGSPVHDLLALLSYLIDPVTEAPLGKPKMNGERRMKQVWASCNDAELAAHAISEPPAFFMNQDHALIQKRFLKAGGAIGAPGPAIAPLIERVDRIRSSLVEADEKKIRLSLGGFVSRLLSMDPFRSSGYTIDLFRQALFTQLLEANVSVTRTSGGSSLEYPMVPRRNPAGKISWAKQYWEMLSAFGQLIQAGGQDDLEVEAFGEDAIGILTFHQSKGLEFDHVYVAMTGKEPDPSAVLATELFTGKTPKYEIINGHPRTRNKRVMTLATADREREIYVAITRAKAGLTILHAPLDDRPMMQLNRGLSGLFEDSAGRAMGSIECTEWIE